MQEIITKITLGDEVTGKNTEEKDFITQSKLDIADIKKMGYEVSIPPEFPEPI